MTTAAQIAAGIRAFAAGDALGVPLEGRSPAELANVELLPIAQRHDWPLGATSDDTAQLLLLGEALVEDDDPAAGFMRRLADAAGTIRGMGPSSRAAIERFRRDGSLVASAGDTNGALMRAPVLGWAARDPDDRRRLGVATTVTTHGGESALRCAQAIAELADMALAGRRLDTYSSGTYEPEPGGVSMQATDTARAVLHLVATADSVAGVIEQAVQLGGDTDTLAAIAGGIVASHPDHADDRIPWIDQVLLPPAEQIERLAEALATRRGS